MNYANKMISSVDTRLSDGEKSFFYAYPETIIKQSSCSLSKIENIFNDTQSMNKYLNDVLDDPYKNQLISILLELISRLNELYDEKGNILLDANDNSWEFELDYSFNRQNRIEIHFICPISEDIRICFHKRFNNVCEWAIFTIVSEELFKIS